MPQFSPIITVLTDRLQSYSAVSVRARVFSPARRLPDWELLWWPPIARVVSCMPLDRLVLPRTPLVLIMEAVKKFVNYYYYFRCTFTLVFQCFCPNLPDFACLEAKIIYRFQDSRPIFLLMKNE